MTVAELIKALEAMPQDALVAYQNYTGLVEATEVLPMNSGKADLSLPMAERLLEIARTAEVIWIK